MRINAEHRIIKEVDMDYKKLAELLFKKIKKMCCHRQHKRYKEVYIEFPNFNLEMELSKATQMPGLRGYRF